MATYRQPKFSLGRCVATPGALETLRDSAQHALEFIARHAQGDWGDVCYEDAKENDLSLERGLRLLSAYKTARGEKLWIITEADRSVTTILLPEEY